MKPVDVANLANLAEVFMDVTNYQTEFGHLETDTVQGRKHQGAAMTLVE